MKNEYINDSTFFLTRAAAKTNERMSTEAVVEAILFLALGVERLLKGVLFALNPVYIYKAQDFKNTVSLIYGERLLPGWKDNKEITGSPDADVLTFKLSLLRTKAISQTAEKHTSMMFALSNWRDIIAHNALSMLDIEKCRTLILRDFYPLMRDFSTELNISISSLLGSHDIRLASLSANHQESIEEKVKVRLDAHARKWEQLQNIPGYAAKMKDKSKSVLLAGIKKRDTLVELVPCPACENDAILTAEVDFDYDDDHVWPVGFFVSSLKCLYCELEIDDYDEIDHLGLNTHFTPEEDFERG
ncbi:MAG: hypothetical protein FP810_06480 [Desulfocapsa sp.]|nr:hypothetical protein [Desulfocapsa sp.]MBU3946437.1 hypothetical protein [Pseudomonadota bacterium]MCG2743389.1 hypothetical protein [Desulfobacteraceae bacterium]